MAVPAPHRLIQSDQNSHQNLIRIQINELKWVLRGPSRPRHLAKWVKHRTRLQNITIIGFKCGFFPAFVVSFTTKAQADTNSRQPASASMS